MTSDTDFQHTRPIAIWLLCVAGLVALMVVVGGLTRLTDSGLSITEWKPVTGAIPPLSAEAWDAEFEKYRQIPEYHLVNKGMTVDEFKEIYYWEWGHRLLGRLIGVAFFIPFVWFLVTGRARGRLAWTLGGLFILGGMQGVLGWYMVMSGLVDRVDVSQYRLAAHLGLAFAIFAALVFVALDLLRFGGVGQGASLPKWRGWALGLFALTFLQIVLGAFVAGLDAGFLYNTWPLMQGAFIPDGLYSSASAIFEDRLTVQFDHRMVAYLLAVLAGLHLWRVLRDRRAPREMRRAAHAFTGLVGVQILLGIWTLLAVVPIWLGGVHQFGAVLVLAGATYQLHVALKGESAA